MTRTTWGGHAEKSTFRRLQRRKPIPVPPSQLPAKEVDWLQHRRYAVVVDAGSSGSRLMVYSWRDVEWERHERMEKDLPLDVLPVVEKGTWEGSARPWQFKVEPGLSSFAGNVSDLRVYLEELFSQVQTIIPPEAWPHTSVHVLATAGMRMLEPNQRQSILQETCRVLRTLPFSDTGDSNTSSTDSACGGQVRVISGEEEGLFGWIAVNYLMDGFRTTSAAPPTADRLAQSGSTTYGFLDMGGASTQIAFEPSLETLAPHANTTSGAGFSRQNDLFDVTFRRLDASLVKHEVFVTTFLGFGTNAARSRYLEALAATHPASALMADPCLPKNLRLPAERGGEVIGTGSFSECLALQEPLLDRDAKCTRAPCLFHGVHVPAIDFYSNQFIGVSEYWYSAHDVFDLGGAYDYTAYQKAARDFCAEDWMALEAKLSQKHYKEQVTLSRLQMQCFKAAWVVTVLHEGLRLPRLNGARFNHSGDAQDIPAKADDKNLFQSVNDVHGYGVSWALGKAVLEASNSVSVAPCETCGPTVPRVLPASAPSLHAGAWPVLAVVVLAVFGGWLVWRIWSCRRSAWMPLPTADTELEKRGDVPQAVVCDDSMGNVSVSDDSVSLRTRRSIGRKELHTVRRGFLARIALGSAAYAKSMLQRVLPGSILPHMLRAEPALSVRVTPNRLRGELGEQTSRDGYPRLHTSYASALVCEPSPTPHTPVLSPTAPPIGPHGAGHAARVVSPSGDAASEMLRTPRPGSAMASGTLYGSRPPSRGPSPLLLESRRTSATAGPSPVRVPLQDTRLRSPVDGLSPGRTSPMPFE